jgi:hypothetical protein
MLTLIRDMWAPPWAWFSDPAWIIVGNLAFWPGYVLYLVVRDRLDRRPTRA